MRQIKILCIFPITRYYSISYERVIYQVRFTNENAMKQYSLMIVTNVTVVRQVTTSNMLGVQFCVDVVGTNTCCSESN